MSVQTEDKPVLFNRASKRDMARKYKGVVRKELLQIPEWLDEDGRPIVVEVRSLLGSERADYMNAMQGQTDGEGRITRIDFRQATGLLAFLSTFMDDDMRLFDDPEDALQYDAAILERINQKAQEISGITNTEVEEAGEA